MRIPRPDLAGLRSRLRRDRASAVLAPLAIMAVIGALVVALVVLRPGSEDVDPGAGPAEETGTAPSPEESTIGDPTPSSSAPAEPGAGADDLRDRARDRLRAERRDTSVDGVIGVASANIPMRSGTSGYNASMPNVLSTDPDFVTLNEQFRRPLSVIDAGAPGYRSFRVETGASDPGSSQVHDNVVMWNTARWRRVDGGRIKTVENDLAYYQGNPVVWDRYVAWGTFERRADGAVVSVISAHQMTNPAKFPRQHGNPALSRAEQYGRSMDLILDLLGDLQERGPVFLAGDMNTFPSYAVDKPWSAAAKMSGAGYGWTNYNVDFIFYPQCQGIEMTDTYSGTMVSDHHWIAARFEMNGAGAGGCDG